MFVYLISVIFVVILIVNYLFLFKSVKRAHSQLRKLHTGYNNLRNALIEVSVAQVLLQDRLDASTKEKGGKNDLPQG